MTEPFLALITPVSAGSPAHPIAPGGPGVVDPGYGVAGPVDPGYGVQGPGPGIWPSPGRPAHPIARPPIFHPGHPDHGLPTPPVAGEPTPPIYHPGHPDHGLPSEPHPDHGLPVPPPVVDNTLPTPPKQGDFLILIYIPGTGFRWIVVDKDLAPEHPIVLPPPTAEHPIAPGSPGAPTQPIQPTPAPKR